VTCSDGQHLAFEQLAEISEASGGELSIVSSQPPTEEGGNLSVRLSVGTGHLGRAENGFRFNAREPLLVYLPPSFPLKKPSIFFAHSRFAGLPHVQWGKSICLYQSSDIEWVASDGMYGFVQRLNEWLRAAALGELDPDNAPLHPPIAYTSSDFKIVVSADAPDIAVGNTSWVGAAHLAKKNQYCLELKEWIAFGEELPKDIQCGMAILLNQPLPMEYPDTVFKLITEFEKRGVSFPLLYDLMCLYALLLKESKDLYVIVGAPMRRTVPGGRLKQHLAAWRISAESAADLRATFESLSNPEDANASRTRFFEWAATAKTEWCRIYENRNETTIRRDINTGASWLKGKRILLLGCGALGSFLAEYVVRAGAKKLVLVDNDTVSPGILVRQLFRDHSIGYTKVSALKLRLEELALGTEIVAEFRNLQRGVLNNFVPDEYDLILDATASRTVSIILEKELSARKDAPPIASFSISAKAKSGMVTVKMSRFSGGPIDIGRRAKIAALQSVGAVHFAKDFWPLAKDIDLFQPEPGCSEPTFIASASDVAFYSSALLNTALIRISELKKSEASSDFISMPPYSATKDCDVSFSCTIGEVKRLKEVKHGYSVLTALGATGSINSEITRNRRVGSELNETGGLLFGSIDDSIERIWIDAASGPPPDSFQSPELFECGTVGTSEMSKHHKEKTQGSSGFVGVWHTHPVSLPRPSQVDLSAMLNILHFQENPPRHVVMLIIGHAATKPVWKYYLFRRNEFTFRAIGADEPED
jgi:proteasome lid subunit RPN8/RPN11